LSDPEPQPESQLATSANGQRILVTAKRRIIAPSPMKAPFHVALTVPWVATPAGQEAGPSEEHTDEPLWPLLGACPELRTLTSCPVMTRQPGDAAPSTNRTPLIEVTVLHEHGSSPSARRLIDAVEVVTANHVYVLDSSLRCVQMRKPGGADVPADPRFVGARLVGGQVNTDESIEISYPFPRPGSLAVFEVSKGGAKHFHTTSAVAKVVVRLSIVTVPRSRVIPTWEEISRAVTTPEED
jgi:hypothetical protein